MFYLTARVKSKYGNKWRVIDTEDLVSVDIEEEGLLDLMITDGVIIENAYYEVIGRYGYLRTHFVPITNIGYTGQYTVIGIFVNELNIVIGRLLSDSMGRVFPLDEDKCNNSHYRNKFININMEESGSDLLDSKYNFLVEVVKNHSTYPLVTIKEFRISWYGKTINYMCEITRSLLDNGNFNSRGVYTRIENVNQTVAEDKIKIEKSYPYIVLMDKPIRCKLLSEKSNSLYSRYNLVDKERLEQYWSKEYIKEFMHSINLKYGKVYKGGYEIAKEEDDLLGIVEKQLYLICQDEASRKMEKKSYIVKRVNLDDLSKIGEFSLPVQRVSALALDSGFIYKMNFEERFKYDPEVFTRIERYNLASEKWESLGVFEGMVTDVKEGQCKVRGNYQSKVSYKKLF